MLKVISLLFLISCSQLPKYTKNKVNCLDRYLDKGLESKEVLTLCNYVLNRGK